VQELCLDSIFRKKHHNQFGFMLADIPYGYFKNVGHDNVLSQEVVTLLCTAAFDLGTTGTPATFVIKMGDRGPDMWRTTLEQAGWYVERDRVILLQKAPWVKSKAAQSHTGKVNPAHYWMIAHKSPNGYFENPKPFGNEVLSFMCIFLI
jgi:hypothetical protein